MRWYVEITPVGKGPVPHRMCLEAPHWQPALQKARRLRGEDDKLGGLSVEFRDDGCSAIDSILRLRYEVSEAPADAPLVEAPTASDLAASAAPARPLPASTGNGGTTGPGSAGVLARKGKVSRRGKLKRRESF